MAKHFEKDMEILSIIAEYPQGLYLSQIQKYAHISSLQNAYKYCKRLIKQGSLTKKDKLYYATGKHLTNSHVVAQKVKQVSSPQAIPTRAHKLGLSYPFLSPLEPDEPQTLFQLGGTEAHIVPLRNNKQAILKIGNITAKITTKHLELYSKDIYTDNRSLSIELEDDIKREFDKVASDIEQRKNLKLKRLKKGIYDTQIIAQHYAEEHHPFAEAPEESHIVLARHPVDHQIRLDTDKSEGFRELEYKHRLSAGTDKDTGDSQFNGILDGKINLWDIPHIKDVLRSITENQQMITDHQLSQDARMDRFTRQIEVHRRVWVKVDRKLSQKRLFEE